LASDDDDDGRLKRLTVRELRERAVKSLGSKASGLKTRQELINALSADDWGAAVEPPSPRGKGAHPEGSEPLPVARDFFVDPRKPTLPASYGDDRLLVFRREPLAVVVSWDLSMATWADGKAVWLELVEPRGRLVARADVTVQTGLATFENLPEHVPLLPQVVRHSRVMTRGRAFSLGPLIEDQLRYQMTVLWDEPLPKAPHEASEAVARAREFHQAGPRPRRSGAVRVVSGLPTSRVGEEEGGEGGEGALPSSRFPSSRVSASRSRSP
jgi:hypothetical protein